MMRWNDEPYEREKRKIQIFFFFFFFFSFFFRFDRSDRFLHFFATQTYLEVQRLARLANALLASAQRTKVLGGLGRHVGEQLKRNAAGRCAANRDIKENLGVRHVVLLL
jgi:hypothetical protein